MNAKTEAAVRKHGENIKAVFGLPVDVDPVNLCRKLRRLERDGAALGLRLCNGSEYAPGRDDEITEDILTRLDSILGYKRRGVPVFVNRDPRGYTLKIESDWMTANSDRESVRAMHRDWGGYGIIAPDLSETK